MELGHQFGDSWIKAFMNREEIEGLSLMHEVGPRDEWCAEAYLKADYNAVSLDNLINVSRKYAINQITNEMTNRS